MNCPVCLTPDTKVTDSRLTAEGFAIRRRRECGKCGYRFSTYEETEILNLNVIKRDGHKEPYDRDKLERGLHKALEKRPVTREDFKKLVNRIERDLQHRQQAEVTSNFIGELVMKRLKKFDTVAYIRFASVYRSFADAGAFQKELSALINPKNQRVTKRTTKK